MVARSSVVDPMLGTMGFAEAIDEDGSGAVLFTMAAATDMDAFHMLTSGDDCCLMGSLPI